jgi:hypothetical protein
MDIIESASFDVSEVAVIQKIGAVAKPAKGAPFRGPFHG